MRTVKKSVGLDISSRSIEVLELTLEKGQMKLSALSRVVLGKGVIEQGRIKDFPTLAQAVKEVMAAATPQAITSDRIVFAYPEAQIYTQMISLDSSKKHLSESIKEKVLSVLPISESDLLYNYRLLASNNTSKRQKVLLLATSRVTVTEWQQFFSRLNLQVIGFTNESVAAYFGLFDRYLKSSKCIVDFGARNVTISFFNSSGLVYAFNYYLGGDYLSKEIARANNINIQEAERLKINIGANTNPKTKAILDRYFKAFGNELKINLEKYQKNINDLPDEIILLGGGSKIKAVEDFIGRAGIGIPIRMGEFSLFGHKGQGFIPAAGLARLGFNSRYNKDKFLVFDKEIELSQDLLWHYFFRALKIFNKKIFNIKLIIALGLIFGSMIIAGVYILVNTRGNNVPELKNKYSFSYTLPLSIPITLIQSESNGVASGRIIKATVKEASDLGTAISLARVKAKALLRSEEILWPKPLTDFSSNQIFPLSVPFLAYSDKEVRAKLSEAISDTLKGSDFLIDEISFLKLSQAGGENDYLLEAKVGLYSNITPNILEEENKNLPEKNKDPMLRINDIGQTLNIYSGPGVDYVVVGQVQPGGYYELLKLGQDWHEIQFNKVSNGWVYANFTTIIKE